MYTQEKAENYCRKHILANVSYLVASLSKMSLEDADNVLDVDFSALLNAGNDEFVGVCEHLLVSSVMGVNLTKQSEHVVTTCIGEVWCRTQGGQSAAMDSCVVAILEGLN